MSDNLIATGEASSHVLRDLFTMPLRDEADGSEGFIDDTKDRQGEAPMVLTSLPDSGVFYPHIIIDRAAQSSEVLDRHGDVWEADIDVRATIHCKSATQANKLADGVVAWFEANQWWLHQNGFMDGSSGPIQDANWDSGSTITTLQVTFSGRLNTTP
jgi:hypothetical protein